MDFYLSGSGLDGRTNTLTANGIGPVTQTNWGQPSGGGGGGIVIDRTTLQVAPDPVRFRVDLTGAGFDTIKGDAGRYDPQAHDAIYLWDLGDSADFVAPEHILPEWRAKRHAKGPVVANCYADPGTYDVSVLVIEKASGKTQTYHAQFVVKDPDTAYPGTQTICINPVGDSDFSGAPAGAVQINSDSFTGDLPEWQAANSQNRGACRYLLKRGGSFEMSIDIGAGVEPHLMIGAYSTGVRPQITSAQSSTGAAIRVISHWQYGDTGPTQDLRIWGLHFPGNFDPTTDPHTSSAGKTRAAIIPSRHVDLVVHDCVLSGFYFSTIISQPVNSGARQHYMLSDCSVTDVGGQYAIFYGKLDNAQSSISHIGCKIWQNPDALSHSGGVYRALTRIEHAAQVHFRACDYFHVERFQPCVKFNETPFTGDNAPIDGSVINIHSCSFEGGLRPVTLSTNTGAVCAVEPAARTTVQNFIFDGCVVVGDFSTTQMLDMNASGGTIRNCLLIMPNTPALPGAEMARFFGLKTDFNAPPQHVLDAPINLYNNTLVNQRTATNNAGRSVVVGADALISTAQIANNISEGVAAQAGVIDGFAPYDSTLLWAPRSKGYKDPATGVLDTTRASPSASVKRYKPQAGSAAIGAATTGRVGARAIDRATRGSPADAGAWEAA